MHSVSPILSAESEYKKQLEEFFSSVYDEKELPSHGLSHHRRVWQYSKELAESTFNDTTAADSSFAANLIIAAYLHDIGMTINKGPDHGSQSAAFCIKFLDDRNMSREEFRPAIDAIINHDKKDYPKDKYSSKLLDILCIADDLDAFGVSGIYRYAEIYLKRNIGFAELGVRIIDNAKTRYRNFLEKYGDSKELTSHHGSRYKQLIDFFTSYNNQLGSYKFGCSAPSGFCGVVEIIDASLKHRSDPVSYYTEYYKHINDDFISSFFGTLMNES
jgi:hypothetical protein